MSFFGSPRRRRLRRLEKAFLKKVVVLSPLFHFFWLLLISGPMILWIPGTEWILYLLASLLVVHTWFLVRWLCEPKYVNGVSGWIFLRVKFFLGSLSIALNFLVGLLFFGLIRF